MCINCPDFVDQCSYEQCYNPDGGKFGMFRKFYVGDRYCEHMQTIYGHEIATFADKLRFVEDD